MITGLKNAFKKMAQRKLLRGDSGSAETINSFGIEGMRSTLHDQPQNSITQKVVTDHKTPEVFVKETTNRVRKTVASSAQTSLGNKGLGNSILGALDN